MFGVLFGDFLDVDAAHVAEDQHRQLAAAVPGDAHVVLLGDGALRLHENRARLLALDDDGQDRVEVRRRLVGVSANFTAPAFMRPPESTWLFNTTGQPMWCAAARASVGGGNHAAFAQGQAVAGEEFLGFVLVKTHSKPFSAGLAFRTDGVRQGRPGRHRDFGNGRAREKEPAPAEDGQNLMVSGIRGASGSWKPVRG